MIEELLYDAEAKATIKKIQSAVSMFVVVVVSMIFFAWLYAFLYGYSTVTLLLGSLSGVFVAGASMYLFLNYRQIKRLKRKMASSSWSETDK